MPISIHAPREGGDYTVRAGPLVWCGISIHAPREGGDTAEITITKINQDFNPRPPRGG